MSSKKSNNLIISNLNFIMDHSNNGNLNNNNPKNYLLQNINNQNDLSDDLTKNTSLIENNNRITNNNLKIQKDQNINNSTNLNNSNNINTKTVSFYEEKEKDKIYNKENSLINQQSKKEIEMKNNEQQVIEKNRLKEIEEKLNNFYKKSKLFIL